MRRAALAVTAAAIALDHDQLGQFRLAAVQRAGARRAARADLAPGLTIIYGTLGVLNLAHGAMFMLGGYAGYVAYTLHGLVHRRGRSPARCS